MCLAKVSAVTYVKPYNFLQRDHNFPNPHVKQKALNVGKLVLNAQSTSAVTSGRSLNNVSSEPVWPSGKALGW